MKRSLISVITKTSMLPGLCLDGEAMRALVDLCHSHGVPVIVDEAHGSHIRALQAFNAENETDAAPEGSYRATF